MRETGRLKGSDPPFRPSTLTPHIVRESLPGTGRVSAKLTGGDPKPGLRNGTTGLGWIRAR